jgi:NAD(P)-dependent dehydrogenase (short-subunit alcohol dehydrogenase family)
MVLQGKVAIVTGASKGIGRAIAERYAREGARVVLASRSPAALQSIAETINSLGGHAAALAVDVSDPRSVESMVRRAAAVFGGLDIMVNNAGTTAVKPSADLEAEAWDRTVKTDLYGVFYGCQSAGRLMLEQGRGGCIINITSIYGICAAPMRAAYCASKAGANMLTQVMAVEWAAHGIRVNAIAPGYVRTELVQGLIDTGRMDVPSIEKRTPLGRMAEARDVEGMAVFLASDEAAYVTGSIMTVDGGWTAYGFL